MSKVSLSMGVLAALVGAATLSAATAHAHIVMTGAILSRGGDQKLYPCDGNRGDGQVYTFEPGTTIKLAVSEYVPHPSYFRIAFDNDGDDFTEPLSIDPIDPNRIAPGQKCMTGNTPKNSKVLDHCGASDFCSTAGSSAGVTVLWDNINPHMPGTSTWSWNIKLPDVECDNCTIQVLQVMEDSVGHGPYCVDGDDCTGDAHVEDIYHRCIDIKLVKGAINSNGATTAPVNVKAPTDGAEVDIECAAQAPGDNHGDAGTVTTFDAGGDTNPQPGSGDTGTGQVASHDGGSTSGGTGTRDAGAKDAGTTKADGASNNTNPNDTSSDDGGCAIAPGTSGAGLAELGSLIALGACWVQRRRRRYN